MLHDTTTKGIYSASPSLAVNDPQLFAWLAEAFLHTRTDDSAPLDALIDSPNYFPLRFKPIHTISLIAASSRLDILRHGMDENLITLKEQPVKGGTLSNLGAR